MLSSDTSDEIHPLLIADLADEESCAILEMAASLEEVSQHMDALHASI